MSNIGQAALTIGGFALGSLVGFPQLGFIAGSLAGNALFPTKLPGQTGPRLSDARTTTAQLGAPVMECLGTDAVAGTVIWMAAIQETSDTESVGGKGGPSQDVTTYSYSQSIAVGLCRGPKQGVLRIWENGKLVFDARAEGVPVAPGPDPADGLIGETLAQFEARQAAAATYAESFTFYSGAEDQMPDPTIELDKGVGNTPAFRGLCYVVFHDRALQAEQALRHPNFKFELADVDPALGPTTVTLLEPGAHTFTANPSKSHIVTVVGGGAGGQSGTLSSLTEANQGGQGGSAGGRSVRTFAVGELSGEILITVGARGLGGLTTTGMTSTSPITNSYKDGTNGGASTFYSPIPLTAGGGTAATGVTSGNGGTGTTGNGGQGLGTAGGTATNAPGGGGGGGKHNSNFSQTPGYSGGAGNTTSPSTTSAGGLGANGSATGHGGTGQAGVDGEEVGGGGGGGGSAYWPNTSGPAQANDGGRGGAGGTPGGGGGGGGAGAYYSPNPASSGEGGAGAPGMVKIEVVGAGTGIVECKPLSEIVSAICLRTPLTAADIDVTEIADVCIQGYTITRVMSASDAIEPLRQIGFFDVVETGEKIIFRKRGGAIAATIPATALGVAEGEAEPPPQVKIREVMEKDLPRVVRLHYKAPSRDYEDGEQDSPSRSTSQAVQVLDIEVAVSIDDTYAAKVAEVLWADAWEGRVTYEIQLDSYYAQLTPGDVIEVPVEGYTQRTRIIDMEQAIPLLRRLTLQRDYDGSYVSQAVANVPQRSPGAVVIYSATNLILLDLPALRDEDDDAGIYATVLPVDEGATWRGASVYRSTDGGATFQQLASITSEPTVGEVVTAIPEGSTATWDNSDTLTVQLQTGALQSRTEAAVIGGENVLAIGAPGRWELLQFTTAELVGENTYQLTNLLRGRRGTEHNMATMQAGDQVVLVSGAGIIRLPLDNAQIGTELLYKTVTIGMAYATGLDLSYTGQGVALLPFSPIDVDFDLEEDGDLLITWKRRGRLGHELTSGQEIPLSEATEAYEIDIVDPSTGTVLRTLTSTTPAVTYGLGERSADFGSAATTVGARVYQVSAVVGRGQPGTGSYGVPADASIYPEDTLAIALSGSFSTTLAFTVQAIFTPRGGSAVVANSSVSGVGYSSFDDMAEELRAELDAALPASVTVSRTGATVTLSTFAGSLSANSTQAAPSALISLLQAPLAATAGVQQVLLLDLWSDSGPALVRAPDSSTAYRTGGSATVGWRVRGITWDTDKAIGYGVNQNTFWTIPGSTYNFRNQALTDAGAAILAVLPQYVDFASYGSATGGARPALVVRAKPGYYLEATLPSGATAGTHPSGYTPEFEQTTAGAAPFPSGAKQRIGTYVGTLPVAPAAGMELEIVLDGITYSHTITAPEAADPYGAGWYTVWEDLRDQIEGSGNFDVYLAHEADNTATPLDIERNVANTPFTSSIGFNTGLTITIT